jgi:hypothetical protein
MNIENQFFAPFAKTFAPFALKKKRLFGQLPYYPDEKDIYRRKIEHFY